MNLRNSPIVPIGLLASSIAVSCACARPIDAPQYQIETFGQWKAFEPIPLYSLLINPAGVPQAPQADPAYAAYTNDELIARLPIEGTRSLRDDTGRIVPNPFAAEWQRRIYSGEFVAEELERAVERSQLVFASPQCVEGQMYYARVRTPSWLSLHDIDVFIRDVEVDGQWVGSKVVTDTLGDEYREPSAPGKQNGVHAIGFLPKGTTKIVLRARIATARNSSGANRFGWVRDFTVPIQMVAPAAPQRSNSPSITREVQEHMPLRAAIEFRDGVPELSVYFESRRPQDGIVQSGALADTMVSAYIEVLRDGKVIDDGGIHDPNEVDLCFDPTERFSGEVANAALDPEQWGRYELRVTGAHPSYLSLWHRTRYWTGTYNVPLADALKSAE